ncbi:hypothetical protein [Acinetobacter colistiniresistens]|uniref:hypothetical protein n=1 Tax=Acinetobacter colistiniresistens TaxID=280145 RepID=UPI00124FAC6B|nr:hypothetical protein [Acinetobacter colistiniresistens]
MSNQTIIDTAPKGATHYFLVPNGSGEPYFVLEKDSKFYWFHGQDEITKPHILSWIKSIESLEEAKADAEGK